MPNLTSVHVTSGIPDSGTGTVSTIDNLPTLMAAITQPVSGTFWQATQPVSGTVAVSSAPTTAVTGTFWQATQPVSGTVATTARDLIYDTGTNGYVATLTLTSGSDLASLASGGAVTLTGGGSAGVSSQSNTASGLQAEIVFKTVTASFTPTAGGCITGWWLKSYDGGTTYETTPATPSTTVPALPRPPDFIIPLDAVALGTSAVKFSNPCVPPPGTFKVLVQNNSGAAFGAGNYTLTMYVYAKKN